MVEQTEVRVISKILQEKYKNLITLDKNRDDITHLYWKKGFGWKPISKDAIRKKAVQLIEKHYPSTKNYTGLANNIMELFNSKTKDAEYTIKWNRTTDQLPIMTPGKSICLRKCKIIKRKKTCKAYKRVEIYEEHYPETQKEFDNTLFKQSLDQWLPDKDDQLTLQMTLGQALIGNPTHTIAFILGKEGTGKSALIQKCLTKTFENYVATLPNEYFFKERAGGKHETYRMPMTYSRYFIPRDEIRDSKTHWSAGAVKSMSAGDRTAANDMYTKSVEFEPIGMPIIVGNYEPVTDEPEGIRRRLLIFRFNNQIYKNRFTEKQKRKLYMTSRGTSIIAWWIIQGLERYYDNNEKIDVSDNIKKYTDEYFKDEDDITADFLDVCKKIKDDKIKPAVRSMHLTEVLRELVRKKPNRYNKIKPRILKKELEARNEILGCQFAKTTGDVAVILNYKLKSWSNL